MVLDADPHSASSMEDRLHYMGFSLCALGACLKQTWILSFHTMMTLRQAGDRVAMGWATVSVRYVCDGCISWQACDHIRTCTMGTHAVALSQLQQSLVD